MSDNAALLNQASIASVALNGVADVILVDGGFIVRAHNNGPSHDSAETETVQAAVPTRPVVQPVPEPPQETHYPPQFIQSPQQNNQFALWQMVQPMFQQNPLAALMMMQALQNQQFPQAQQYPQFPQFPVAQFPQYSQTPVTQSLPTYLQSAQQAQPVQVAQQPIQTVQETTPVEEVKKSAKSIRKERKAAAAAEVAQATVTQAAAPQSAPAAQTSEVPKGRWADIANSGSAPKPVRQTILPPAAGIPVKKNKVRAKDNSRANKDSVDRVDISAVSSYKPKLGYVSGPNLQRNRPSNPEIPICTIKHTREECEGECDWVQCVDHEGELISGATSPFANKAAHCNAVSDDAPSTADFCKNQIDGAPACDIHGCTVLNCVANHVGKFETRKEVLDQVKSSMRRPRTRDNNGRSSNSGYKPRSRAIGANGDHPEDLTVGDFRIMVEAGVTLNLEESPLNMSTGSANNIPVGTVDSSASPQTVSPPANRPIIMKKSIEGVPAKITGKTGNDKAKESSKDAGKESGKESAKEESK